MNMNSSQHIILLATLDLHILLLVQMRNLTGSIIGLRVAILCYEFIVTRLPLALSTIRKSIDIVKENAF